MPNRIEGVESGMHMVDVILAFGVSCLKLYGLLPSEDEEALNAS